MFSGRKAEKRRAIQQRVAQQLTEEMRRLGRSSADDWNDLGADYHRGTDGRRKDDFKALICFSKAISQEARHKQAHYNTGCLLRNGYTILPEHDDGHFFQSGYKTSPDINAAKRHLLIVAEDGYLRAIRQYLEIEFIESFGKDAFPSMWGELGNEFQFGHGNRKVNYQFAACCYLIYMEKGSCIWIDDNAADFGLLYCYGRGISKSYLEATKLFIGPLLRYFKGQIDINKIGWSRAGVILERLERLKKHVIEQPDLSFNERKEIYELVYDLFCRYTLFVRAKIADLAKSSRWNTIMEEVPFDLIKDYVDFSLSPSMHDAYDIHYEHSKIYRKLCEIYNRIYNVEPHGFHLRFKAYMKVFRCFKLILKTLERDIAHDIPNINKVVYVQGGLVSPLIHMTARTDNLKNFARLVLLNADTSIINRDGRKAWECLSTRQRGDVRLLQNEVANDVVNHEKSAVDVIADRIFSANGNNSNRRKLISALPRYYAIPDIKPLLDLTKLAVLGRHRLSRRPCVIEDGYDSDEDIQTTRESANTLFSIIIDPSRRNVTRITELDDIDTVGIYHPAECYAANYLGNIVAIGGNRSSSKLVHGTTFHEITHFITYEVFDNEGKPYRNDDAGDEALRRRFNRIADAIHENQTGLDPIITGAFQECYISSCQIHQELIVRVAQMLIVYSDGAQRLRRQVPELFDYYQDTFLPAVKAHTEKLEKRMWGGWNPSLFCNQQHATTDQESVHAQSGKQARRRGLHAESERNQAQHKGRARLSLKRITPWYYFFFGFGIASIVAIFCMSFYVNRNSLVETPSLRR